MTVEARWDIPDSWEWAEIGNLGEVIGGGTPSTKEPSYWGDDINWISPADLTGYTSKTIFHGAKGLTEAGLNNSAAKLMPAGSVHFSSRAPIGYVVISGEPLATNQGFKSLVPENGVLDEYVYYYLKSAKQYAEGRATGTTFLELSGRSFSKLPIPVAPSSQQPRIVAKIEELFSELDNGIESLNLARAQIKIYRLAVLKHAFEGKLTARWRNENQGQLESADQLLAQIRGECEAKHQEQIEEWSAAVQSWEDNGKKGKRPKKPRQQKDTGSPDSGELKVFPTLPQSWTWVKLGQLVWSVKDGPHYSPKYAESGIPFISGGNVRPNGIDFSTAKYITEELHEQLSLRCKPEKGDVLYTKGGTTGIARVNTYDIDFNVWVHVAVLKITDSLEPFYLQHALNSPSCYQQSQKYTHGVGNQDLGLTRMVNIVLPLCSRSEQTELNSIVDKLTSEFDAVEKMIVTEIERAHLLRQSILKRAFSGRLVGKDPNDEPASALLARIKAQKEEREKAKKAAKKKVKKKAKRKDAA